jgi:hypothetical protein
MRLGFLRVLIPCAIPLLLGGCGGGAIGGFGNTFNTPVISSISPTTVAPGGTLTITGQYFNGTNTEVFFSTYTSINSINYIYPTSGNIAGTSVTVTVPGTLPAGSCNVYVESTDQQGNVSSPSNSVTITVS